MVAFRLDIKVGDYIDARYRVIEPIGTGSFGDVFKVKDEVEHVICALKILRLWEEPNNLHDALIDKFNQEFETSRISSDYLIHCVNHGIVRGNPYIVMEFCHNGDLSKKMGMPPASFARYAGDILEGIHALHIAGKVHRDLKPENVLIRDNGHAALTDFGIIGEMDKNKRRTDVGFLRRKPRQAFGTPLYMSPEMYNRKAGGVTYLPTVDIWSFGVMMYEVLTGGIFPFGNIEKVEDFPAYQKRAQEGEWDRRSLMEKAPEWENVIGGCLNPDFRYRYQSALEVMQELGPIIGNLGDRYIQERKSRSANISGLTVSQGKNLGQSYILSTFLSGGKRMITIGRSIENDIVLCEDENTYVSRRHFTLERSQNGQFWKIYDGQWSIRERRWVTSTNGTYLNSVPVPPRDRDGLRLFTGDIITVGEYKLKIE